ncbi:MAG TPA: gephyrin-like molybdotransferase Glp [Geothermobacteraceae bacterium]|nr:gephyrin-like molybdotransferase Glp [Geothermobacteraceae bacterium]
MPIQFEDARNLILDATGTLEPEQAQLLDAVGRVLAEDFHAPWDLPLWDNSAMDGFAVQAADAATGKELEITGYIPAGGAELPPVAPGCAVKIMTGAPIPPGCELVVPVEETEERDGKVKLLADLRVREHIRFKGEDVATGDKVLAAGTLLRPPEISLLASFGQSLVQVHRRPRVAILSTGDELIDLGMVPGPGQIINSNIYSLAAAVRDAGGEPQLLGIARDNLESHREKLTRGLKADVLITSAGVSAGDRDLVRDVLEELGVEQKFWKIAIKPGRPTAFGVRGETLVFSLPGNPVSTMVTFEMFVRPALRKLQGVTPAVQPFAKARLAETVRKRPERVQFLRVQVRIEEGRLIASSSGDQNTGIVRTMVRANGIVVLPAERDRFEAGSEVEVLLLD